VFAICFFRVSAKKGDTNCQLLGITVNILSFDEKEAKTAMQPLCRTIAISVTTLLIVLVYSPVLPGDEEAIDLDFKHHTVSADIEGAPLRAVIEEIKKKVQGIWFKEWLKRGTASLSEKISVEFEDLPIRMGMERIFSTMNHSLVFDGHNRLLGIFLLGKPEKPRIRTRIRRGTAKRRSPARYIRRK
jgi:hypothetical protein